MDLYISLHCLHTLANKQSEEVKEIFILFFSYKLDHSQNGKEIKGICILRFFLDIADIVSNDDSLVASAID